MPIFNNTNDYCLLVIKLIMLQKRLIQLILQIKLFMVGSMLHCFPTFVYFQLIAVTISSVLSPWIHDGIYSFTQWSTCIHLSAILYGPANVHDFSRGEMLMNKPYEWYGKWYICKFHWNCIFEVWIQKQSWNVSFLKEQNTELHAMWGDR